MGIIAHMRSGSALQAGARTTLAAVLACSVVACQPNVSAVLAPAEDEAPIAGSSYAQVVQRTPGLAAYFRFSEPGGATAVDRVKGYRLTADEGARIGADGAIANDPEEGAVSFDGSVSSRLTMPLPNSFQTYSRALSLEVWIKLRGAAAGCLQPSRPLAKVLWVEGVIGGAWGLAVTGDASDTLTFELLLDTKNGYATFDATTAAGSVEPGVGLECEQGPWQHVVATFDVAARADHMKIYVDGALARSPQNPLSLNVAPGTVIAGFEVVPRFDVGGSGAFVDQDSGTLGEPMDGWIDELAVYSRALTEGEVLEHFNAAGR